MGRHRAHSSQCQDRAASSRSSRKRHLCGQRTCTHALGEHLQFTAEAGPGDFIYVPPYVPHQEINASRTKRSSVCWFAATARRSRSIWTSSLRSPRKRSRGWTRSIARLDPFGFAGQEPAHSNREMSVSGQIFVGPMPLPNRGAAGADVGRHRRAVPALGGGLGAGLVISEMTACAAPRRRKAHASAGAPKPTARGRMSVQLAGCEARWMAEGGADRRRRRCRHHRHQHGLPGPARHRRRRRLGR